VSVQNLEGHWDRSSSSPVISVVPPGYEYSWYNIRTSISDEGHFYAYSNLVSRRVDGQLTLGSLDILLERSKQAFGPCTHEAVIVYFMIVVLADSLSKVARKLR
jgi:hypothetical protein